jgi:pimeloyl-ACP methyl ester carboxylesterase
MGEQGNSNREQGNSSLELEGVQEGSETRAITAFHQAEARVFASYSLKLRTRLLRLQTPRLQIRSLEVGSGEPVLFMHGFSLCVAHWAPLMARLPSLRCIAIDMPGHGGSDRVNYDGVDLRTWYRDMLTGCLDQLELDSAHLVGIRRGRCSDSGLRWMLRSACGHL